MLEKLKAKIQNLKVKSDEFLESIKLPEEIRQSRYSICNDCEFFFKPTTTCLKCGCVMAAKTYLPSASCPIGKWQHINIIRE